MCHDNEYSHRRPPIINQLCVYVDGCIFGKPVERPVFFFFLQDASFFFFIYELKNEAKN